MKDNKQKQKGEILTILTLVTLLIIGASTVVSSVFLAKKSPSQTTKTMAAVCETEDCSRSPNATVEYNADLKTQVISNPEPQKTETTTKPADKQSDTLNNTEIKKQNIEQPKNNNPVITAPTSPPVKPDTVQPTKDPQKLSQEFIQNPAACLVDTSAGGCRDQVIKDYGNIPGANESSWKCDSPSDPNCDKCGYAGWNPNGCGEFTKPDSSRQVNPQGIAPTAWIQRNAAVCGGNVDKDGNCITPTPVPQAKTGTDKSSATPAPTKPNVVITSAPAVAGTICSYASVGACASSNCLYCTTQGCTGGSAKCSIPFATNTVTTHQATNIRKLCCPTSGSCISVALEATCPNGFSPQKTTPSDNSGSPALVVPTVPYSSNVKAVTIDAGAYAREVLTGSIGSNTPTQSVWHATIDVSTMSICTHTDNGNYSCENPVAKQQLGNSSVYYVQYNVQQTGKQLICANTTGLFGNSTGETCFPLK